MHPSVEKFTHSLSIDARLWECDLAGSIAHARMLGKVGVLSAEESTEIVDKFLMGEGCEMIFNSIRDLSDPLQSKLLYCMGEIFILNWSGFLRSELAR